MPKYIEKDTQVEVEIVGYMAFREGPVGALVTYPDGTIYSIELDRVGKYFDMVTPQHIELKAVANIAYSRFAPYQPTDQLNIEDWKP